MKQHIKDKYLVVKDQSVFKSNDLIQKSRFNLSLQEQKILLYLISQITPYDEDFQLYEFSVSDFCRICGMSPTAGGNYTELKAAIKSICDKSLWIQLAEGEETLLRWIEKPYINKRSGTIKIRLDKDMKPFLLQLKENFTSYELIFTLKFSSKYSIRLYELICSIHYHDLETYKRNYGLDELRQLLGAENYTTWQALKERVLVPAMNEINKFSDKNLSINPIKKPHSRGIIGVELVVSSKDSIQALKLRNEIERDFGYDQLSLWDEIEIRGKEMRAKYGKLTDDC